MNFSKWAYFFFWCYLALLEGCNQISPPALSSTLFEAQSVTTDALATEQERIKAAEVLGNAGTDTALDSLQIAAAMQPPPDTLNAIVANLGKYPFRQTGGTFKRWLADKRQTAEFKVHTMEALANTDQQGLSLLMESSAAPQHNPEIRAAAAWAISQNSNAGNIGQALAKLLKTESTTIVRRRLYEALMRQDDIPAEELMDQALHESDPSTRVAAFNALAVSFHSSAGPSNTTDRFIETVIPELETVALGSGSLNLRMRSVFALIRCGLPEAEIALQHIAQAAQEPVSGAAARGLVRMSMTSAR